MAARKLTAVGRKRRASMMRREAERLGTTSKYLSARWKKARGEMDAYRKWRQRLIDTLSRESGLSKQTIENLGYVPPKMGAKLSEFGSLEELNAYLKSLRSTRKNFDKNRKLNKKQVQDMRQRMEANERERQRMRQEEPRAGRANEDVLHADYQELTRAQRHLVDRIEDSVELDGNGWQNFVDEVAELDDMQVAEIMAIDRQRLKLLQSPKLLQDDPEAVDKIDATTNEDRIKYVKKLIRDVL